jgi:hypothetical protein
MELIDNPEWLVGQRVGCPLGMVYDVVHRTDPTFLMEVYPGTISKLHAVNGMLWSKDKTTWWGRKPWVFEAKKLKGKAFEKFVEYFHSQNAGRRSPTVVDGYYTTSFGRGRRLYGFGYGMDWFVGRPPEARKFYGDDATVFDDWVVHLAEPTFVARVRDATNVVSVTSVRGDTLDILPDLKVHIVSALRSYYYHFFANLDGIYAEITKPFVGALYENPFLDPQAPDYQPDYEFDERFDVTVDASRINAVFDINLDEKQVYCGNERLKAPAEVLDFKLSDAALATLWQEGWFESRSVPVNDRTVWVQFPRDNPYITVAIALLAAFLEDVPSNSGNTLVLRLFVPLARELAHTLRTNEASVSGQRLEKWVKSQLQLPPGAPVSLFDESAFRTTCAMT